jgi:serine/threonine protein phosphatase PrpC
MTDLAGLEHLRSRLQVTLAQRSEAGRKPENQDTIGARIPAKGQLVTKGVALALADGVSSSRAARQASQTAVTGFLTDYYATPDTWRTQESAAQVIESLNRYLWSQSRNNVLGEGYLTTLSALVLKGDTAFVFHAGDSRVYHLRDGVLEQLTRDHTQKISAEVTYLSRALGADPHLELDVHSVELQLGDCFILTSDGVHEAMPAQRLRDIAEQCLDDPEAMVTTAMNEALANGSQDNLSIQVVRVDALGTPSQADAINVLSQLPFPPLLAVGEKLDGLAVEKILHESERSQVYLVKTSTGRPLVMKTPSRLYRNDLAYIERFVLESWIGTRVHSPNVARVIPAGQARSCLYYLTEHIPGPTLAGLIRERAPFAVTDAVEIIVQLVKGVRSFHRRDTLHQDLKPDNVVIGPKGAVIIDFGSCWIAGIQEAGAPFAREQLLGSLDYAAPEYRTGGAIGAHSDQFSLAVILYEMLTGRMPYGEAYSSATDARAFQRVRYIPASRHNPLVPVWLDKALEKALSLHPRQRYAALSEWVQDLQQPNPRWLRPQDQPLVERNPTRFWQLVAVVGWLVVAVLAVRR